MYYHVIDTAEVLGNSVNELTVNRSSIRHTPKKYRKGRAERISRDYNWVKAKSQFLYTGTENFSKFNGKELS